MAAFSKTHQALLACLKSSICQKENDFNFSDFKEEDWQKLLAESRAQAVDVLCYDATKGLAIPQEIDSKWLFFSTRFFLTHSRIMTVQRSLTEILEKNSIPYVILKGFSSASYYPKPNNRVSGDIDFLVPKDKIGEATNLLKQSGARPYKRQNENHLTFDWNRVRLELHHSIAGIPNNKYGKIFDSFFEDIFCRAVKDSEDGFKRPCDAMHGAVILLHTIHHIALTGVGLRHLCDWACFVNKTYTQSFWQEELLPLLKKVGLMKFASIMIEASIIYLGINRPAWHTDECKEQARALILDVISSGNFGKKLGFKAGAAIMANRNGQKSSFFSKIKTMKDTLKLTNRAYCPTLNRLPWLEPLVTAYRTIRYLILMLCGKRASFAKASRYSKERSNFLEMFELYNNKK